MHQIMKYCAVSAAVMAVAVGSSLSGCAASPAADSELNGASRLRSLESSKSSYHVTITPQLTNDLRAAGYDAVMVRQKCRRSFDYKYNEATAPLQDQKGAVSTYDITTDACSKAFPRTGYVSAYELLAVGPNGLRLSCGEFTAGLESRTSSVGISKTLRSCQNFPKPVDAKAFCASGAFAPSVDYTKFSPQIRMHPKEQLFPSTIEYGLNDASLCKDNTCIPATEANMKNVSGQGWSLQKLPQYYGGMAPDGSNHIQAPMYVHVRDAGPDVPYVDIQYWFYYPDNGCANMQIGVLKTFEAMYRRLNMKWCSWGVHEGDWEHVAVKVCKDNERVHSVFYAKHSENIVKNCAAGECEFVDGTHPVGYSALASHATYPTAETDFRNVLPKAIASASDVAIAACGVMDTIILIDLTADGGALWEPWKVSNGLVLIDGASTPITYFDGPWCKGITKKDVQKPQGLDEEIPCGIPGLLAAGSKVIAAVSSALDGYLLNESPRSPLFQGWWNQDF